MIVSRRLVQGTRRMRLLSLISLLGVSSCYWTIATPLTERDYHWDVDGKGILRSVSAAANTSHIDLSSKNIRYIAWTAFDDLSNVKSLDLSNNRIARLRLRSFSKLNDLEELSLANNVIGHMFMPFVGLNNLKRLDLSNNSGPSLMSGVLFGLSNSTEIIIEGSNIGYISSRVFQDPSIPALKFEEHDTLAEYAGRSFDDPLPNNLGVKICKTDDGLVTSVEELKQNEPLGNCMRATVLHVFRQLELSNLGLKKFQRGWYKLSGDLVSELDLSHNHITDITPELLNDLPSKLSAIHLEYNNITMIKRNVIHNRIVRELYLGHNPISIIENMAFEKTDLTSFSVGNTMLDNLTFVRTLPRTIEHFEFFSSPITEIPVNTFQGFKNLKSINLFDNRLEKIEPGTFEDQENLVGLSLMANRLRELNPGIFKGLKKLKDLNLMINNITNISRDTFSEFRNVNALGIHMSDNQINFIEEGSFSGMNITTLSLSSNRITDESIAKGAFNACTLNILSLRKNLMTKINGESFEGTLSSYMLDLGENQIKTIEKGAAKNMKNVRVLNLEGNPLERFQNGALYGLSKDKDVAIHFGGAPVKLIQGGLFDNV